MRDASKNHCIQIHISRKSNAISLWSTSAVTLDQQPFVLMSSTDKQWMRSSVRPSSSVEVRKLILFSWFSTVVTSIKQECLCPNGEKDTSIILDEWHWLQQLRFLGKRVGEQSRKGKHLPSCVIVPILCFLHQFEYKVWGKALFNIQITLLTLQISCVVEYGGNSILKMHCFTFSGLLLLPFLNH